MIGQRSRNLFDDPTIGRATGSPVAQVERRTLVQVNADYQRWPQTFTTGFGGRASGDTKAGAAGQNMKQKRLKPSANATVASGVSFEVPPRHLGEGTQFTFSNPTSDRGRGPGGDTPASSHRCGSGL